MPKVRSGILRMPHSRMTLHDKTTHALASDHLAIRHCEFVNPVLKRPKRRCFRSSSRTFAGKFTVGAILPTTCPTEGRLPLIDAFSSGVARKGTMFPLLWSKAAPTICPRELIELATNRNRVEPGEMSVLRSVMAPCSQITARQLKLTSHD